MRSDSDAQRSEILSNTYEWSEHIVTWFERGYGNDGLSAIPQLPANLERGVTVAICTYKRAASLNRLLDSLSLQDRQAEQLVIIDASPDDGTEQMIRGRDNHRQLARRILYFRVTGPLKGLTHQRNFALRYVTTDLIVFFDDDVVLQRDCVFKMEIPFRSTDGEIIGVGAYIVNTVQRLDWETRQRLIFGVISDCAPGRYHRSGMSTSWRFLPRGSELVEGDWLPGGASMWKTEIARAVGFHDGFNGYSQGEDLDFSLQMKKRGKLVLASNACLEHCSDPSGRPDPFQHGYMFIRNKFEIHGRAFSNRTCRDMCWFAYAWTLDTLFLTRHLLFPGRIQPTVMHILGRLKAAIDIIAGRQANRRSPIPRKN